MERQSLEGLYIENLNLFREIMNDNLNSYIKVIIRDDLTWWDRQYFFLINNNFIQFLETVFQTNYQKIMNHEYVNIDFSCYDTDILTKEEYLTFSPIAKRLNIKADAYIFKDNLDINKVIKKVTRQLKNDENFHIHDYFKEL